MKFVFFLMLAVFTTACQPEAAENEPVVFQKESVRIIKRESGRPETALTVEIADTEAKRRRGLMYRTSLADDAGMLFLFPVRKRISMWMANTSVSLDMIFLDEQGKIREIVENTVPFSHDEIRSEKSVKGVLEIKAGQAKRLDIQKGDKLEHPFFTAETGE